ncbi:MAG TPA: hypothetical protein VFJ83_00170 [Nocardioidaceae bacterium]|nr:hypothetical protein [Nocardioidaceae bacterium]
MNNFDEKDMLTRELRERSTDVGGHPIGFDAVRQSARKIQRRRSIVSGAVAAVVATIAVPAGVAVTSAINDPNDPAKTPTIATSPSPTATPRPDGTFPFTIKGLPRGESPQLNYVVAGERTMVTPEGEVELPEAYSQVVPYRDGWLALYGGQNGYENVILDEDMGIESTTLAGEAIAVSADGSRVLTAQRDFNVRGRTVVLDSPATSNYEREQITWDAPDNSWVKPVGYLDEQAVVFQATDEEGRTEVLMGVDDNDPRTVPLEGFLNVSSTSAVNGLVAGQVSYDDKTGRGCYAAMDPRASTTKMVWETCDYEPQAFSPDGRFVVAGAPDSDGLGSPTLTILDARSGDPVVEFSPPKDVMVAVTQAAWEDDHTVVATVIEGIEMRLVRADVAGNLELAGSVSHTMDDMNLPLWLAETPRW